jgi:hypothetical protein
VVRAVRILVNRNPVKADSSQAKEARVIKNPARVRSPVKSPARAVSSPVRSLAKVGRQAAGSGQVINRRPPAKHRDKF